jgi:hypothetical protein
MQQLSVPAEAVTVIVAGTLAVIKNKNMEKYRVLNITDTTMENTNQRVAVIELVKVEYHNFTLPSGKQSYTFGSKGERFIIDFESSLTQQIILLAQNEDIIELNKQNFKAIDELRNNKLEKIYYHNNVTLFNTPESEFKKEVFGNINIDDIIKKSAEFRKSIEDSINNPPINFDMIREHEIAVREEQKRTRKLQGIFLIIFVIFIIITVIMTEAYK